jgi:presenilin-like A22 family membrane protease
MSLIPFVIAFILVLDNWKKWERKPAKNYQVIKHFEYVVTTSIGVLIASLIDSKIIHSDIAYLGVFSFVLLTFRLLTLFSIMKHKGWVVCYKSNTYGYLSQSYMLYNEVESLIDDLKNLDIDYKVYEVSDHVKACDKDEYYLSKYIHYDRE